MTKIKDNVTITKGKTQATTKVVKVPVAKATKTKMKGRSFTIPKGAVIARLSIGGEAFIAPSKEDVKTAVLSRLGYPKVDIITEAPTFTHLNYKDGTEKLVRRKEVHVNSSFHRLLENDGEDLVTKQPIKCVENRKIVASKKYDGQKLTFINVYAE